MRMLRFSLLLAPIIATFVIAACGGPTPPPFKPIADNKLLMEAVMDPAADKIWDSVAWIITQEGTEEVKPRNNEEWVAVRNAAVTLAESGNLLMMVPRAKDGDEWMRLSAALVDASRGAIEAADAKNVEKTFSVGGDIYVICSNCHQKYMEPKTAGASE
jgi:hypothetical protein